MEDTTFAELGRRQAIVKLFEGTPYKAFQEPLWMENKAGDVVTNASRTLTEGIDFDLVYFPLKHLGYKSVVSVTGELLCVMSHPETLSVVLGVSAKLDFPQVRDLWSGIVAAAREFGYKDLSLDLQPSRNGLFISVSACGRTSKLTCVRRPAAKSKDLVCVSGRLGAAFLGLQVLERGKSRFESGASGEEELKQYRMLVGAYLKPELNAGVVKDLEDASIVPSHGYFITRGLADAVLRLSSDSGLGVKIYADKIPFEGNSFSLGKELDVDPVSAAMNGGDDCQILFTVPILKLEEFRHECPTFDIIGHLAQEDVGAVLVLPTGVEIPVSAQGWEK